MAVLLFLAGGFGAALNAVAGGGSFIGLPMLMLAGVPPVAANATTTMALWPGALSSAVAYRREIRPSGNRVLPLAAASLVGGFLGSVLLVRTSDTSFLRLLPWLMLLATMAFTFSPVLTRLRKRKKIDGSAHQFTGVLLQFAIAIYGGYFGGGMGIMMLGVMALAGMTDIHEMNGLKNVLGVAINGIALAEFIIYGAVVWHTGLPMMFGAVAGGYAAASLARVTDRRHIRQFIITIGWAMTIYFFVRKST